MALLIEHSEIVHAGIDSLTSDWPDALKAELGDETLWLETDDPTGLRDRIDAQFGVPTRIVGSMVQVAPPHPAAFFSNL
mgnify:CR=1 FL=1